MDGLLGLGRALRRAWCCTCCAPPAHRVERVNGRTLLVGHGAGGHGAGRHGVLGEGAFSTVYAVVDAQTGEPFALKCMLCQSGEQLESARKEIRVHSTVGHHPGLLPLLDSVEVKTGPRGAITVKLLLPL